MLTVKSYVKFERSKGNVWNYKYLVTDYKLFGCILIYRVTKLEQVF